MAPNLFPNRIETSRLSFERLSHDTVDPFEFYTFVTQDEWQGDATEHMPWFRFQQLDEVADFIDRAEQQWTDCDGARYLVRSREEDDEIVGITAYNPEWEKRRGSSDIVLSKQYWGREYGLERAAAFIELTFEKYDLDAYCTTCAADNEPSRRMIEKIVETYGGEYEGLLRQHGSPRPTGEITDQHRFTILRDEYKEATQAEDVLNFEMEW